MPTGATVWKFRKDVSKFEISARKNVGYIDILVGSSKFLAHFSKSKTDAKAFLNTYLWFIKACERFGVGLEVPKRLIKVRDSARKIEEILEIFK